jgi:hypothetical protein
MYRGRLSAPVARADADISRIGLMMAGVNPDSAFGGEAA